MCSWLILPHLVVSINGDTPLSLDGLFPWENPIYKWMITGGALILGNLHLIPQKKGQKIHHPTWRPNRLRIPDGEAGK